MYINLWTQIANEFKDYNEYLIFESMDEVFFYNYTYSIYDYTTLTNLNQAFVDAIRNTGGNNIERLLIIAGANDDLEMTCFSDYKIPVDQSKKLAVSIHILNHMILFLILIMNRIIGLIIIILHIHMAQR